MRLIFNYDKQTCRSLMTAFHHVDNSILWLKHLSLFLWHPQYIALLTSIDRLQGKKNSKKKKQTWNWKFQRDKILKSYQSQDTKIKRISLKNNETDGKNKLCLCMSDFLVYSFLPIHLWFHCTQWTLVLHSISVFERLDILFVSHFPGLPCKHESQSCISMFESGITFLAF